MTAVGAFIIVQPFRYQQPVPVSEALKQALLLQDLADDVFEEGRDVCLGDVFGDIRESSILPYILNVAGEAPRYVFPGRLQLIPVDPSGIAEDVEMRMPVIRAAGDFDDRSAAGNDAFPDSTLPEPAE